MNTSQQSGSFNESLSRNNSKPDLLGQSMTQSFSKQSLNMSLSKQSLNTSKRVVRTKKPVGGRMMNRSQSRGDIEAIEDNFKVLGEDESKILSDIESETKRPKQLGEQDDSDS